MSNVARRSLTAVAVVFVLVGAIVAVTAGWVGANPRRITVFEPTGEGFETWFDLSGADTGPGADPGDMLLEHRPLLDPESGEPAGSAVTRVQVLDVVDGNPTFVIDCTIRLADGDLVFYGAGEFGALGEGVEFAVTGGTGAYDRAAGTVTVRVAEDGATIAFALSKR